ncbi:MAG: hypothetical protein A2487_13610 [Candidatus Raymondbacteria bacterium RifOxyC12_full_50_8]|uniref:Uncharacterized protein n=1 Tax=Candidatus Raymondbacteria bacterium RIFOXYD12_FULL_49_13 TaxID=1817890 RepID=A0A1F7F665_UNCRA|nr:MAG: hypothetical protein A2487_13610 [Candidatus Raymondbacteria bacterium RifOxyC12_full_50_8]OGK02164.1 MAG: hypothetical protein A2519_19010 [Candidatus Raymondbacteria bacterium RIFOXYD12_FULL_49_13]
MPSGLSSDPQEQTFNLTAGDSVLLVFKVTNASWGDSVYIRPQITVNGSEQLTFSDSLVTNVIRNQAILNKAPLDTQGLLVYYSCGDAMDGEYKYFDRSVGDTSFWEEGIWYHDGGVKGKCVRGYTGLPFPRNRYSKIAYTTLNNINYQKGTILFWIRKEERENEISYAGSFNPDPNATWQVGPTAMDGLRGEGIVGWFRAPQWRYMKDVLGMPTAQCYIYKTGSNSFIGLRRYKAYNGNPGYLEAMYLAMRGKTYHAQAHYDWTADWRHVALLWDAEAGRLEIYLDGVLASGEIKCNGRANTDSIWYGAPWDVVTNVHGSMGLVQQYPEGAQNATRRDEYYVYNKALSLQEIEDNMRASMGKVLSPSIFPHDTLFHDTLTVEIKSLWSNTSIHYTLNGIDPVASDPVYSGQIVLNSTTTIKARAFLQGYTPSDIVSAHFECMGLDAQKPAVRQIIALNDPNHILVAFDKPVEQTSAENSGNYTVNNGITITQAHLDDDKQCIRLTTSAPLESRLYTITVKNVRDLSKSANIMNDLVDTNFKFETLSGLVGYWNFDVLTGKGDKVKDLSQSKIDGAVWDYYWPSATALVDGYKEKGMYFDGRDAFLDVTDYVNGGLSVNTNAAINLDAGTVSCWFKADSDLPNYQSHIIYKNYAYDIHITSKVLCVKSEGSPLYNTGIMVADGNWHQVVFAFQKGVTNGSSVYLDGNLLSARTFNFLNNTHEGLSIGGGGGAYGQPIFFKGIIDEVMIFNRVLNSNEVSELYQTGGITAKIEEMEQDIGVQNHKTRLMVCPNPFNPTTVITIRSQNTEYRSQNAEIKARTTVRVAIYDINGKCVWTALNMKNNAGLKNTTVTTCIWDASAQPSGIYIVKAKVGDKVLIKIISLTK